jgi:adenylate cyclase class 2
MNYEVEQKFPVRDLPSLEAKIVAMGVTIAEPRREVDEYFKHPARDFAVTDEALRIRRVGEQSLITYKGPKIDATTKTRREIELPLSGGRETADSWERLLEALGFTPVAKVRKNRRKAFIPWQGRNVEASLDEVDWVGSFLELELIAAEEDLEPAKACIAALAEAWGLSGSERRSYLELLMERRAR